MRRLAPVGSGGLGDGFPTVVWALVSIVFATWALQFFAVTAPLIGLLRLTPAVWRSGFVWQLASYPFAGIGPPTPWILLELFIVAMFAASVVARTGRRGLWRLVLISAAIGGAAAVGVDALASTWRGAAASYPLVQGQRVLMAILVAAFATLNPRATIHLFFVLPMPARWFIPLEVLLAFIGFLASKDLPGFIGLLVAIGVAWALMRGGGVGRALRDLRLRIEAAWIRLRMRSQRRRRGFVVVPGGKDSRPN